MHALFLNRYEADLSDLRYTVDSGRYNCLTSTLLYTLAAREAGLLAGGYVMRGHVLAIVFGAKGPLFVETTNPDVPITQTWQPRRSLYDSIVQMSTEGIIEAEEDTAYDIPAEAMVSLVFWNQTIMALQKKDATQALLNINGVFKFGKKKEIDKLWQLMIADLYAFVDEAAKAQGWEAAAQILDTMVELFEKHSQKTKIRDVRASLYLSWIQKERSKNIRCKIWKRLKKVDPNHPATVLGANTYKCDD